MAENALFSSLADFNQQRDNKYRQNWGSLMSFLDAEDTDALTSKINNVHAYMDSKVVKPIEDMLSRPVHSPTSTLYDRGTAATLRGSTAEKHSATARTLFSRSTRVRQHLAPVDSMTSYVYMPDHRLLRMNQSALRSGDITVSPSKVSLSLARLVSETKSSVRLPDVPAMAKRRTVGIKVVEPRPRYESVGAETSTSVIQGRPDPFAKVKARVNSFRRPTESERAAQKMFGQVRRPGPRQYTPEKEEMEDAEFIDPNIKLKPEHHITRSLLKIQQQNATSKQLQKRSEETQRIMNELKASREAYGLRHKNEDGSQRDMPPLKRPVPIKPPAARMEQAELALDRKLGKEKNPKQMLAAKENETWLRKKRQQLQSRGGGAGGGEGGGAGAEDSDSNRKHIEFAKNLFILWDDDGSGELDITEITKPLITLGLSTDSQFVKKLIKALHERKRARTDDESLTLELQDFVRIFGSDAASNKVAQVLRSDYNKRLVEKQRLEAIKNRPKRESIIHKTPRSTQPNTSAHSPSRRVSFAYRSAELQAVVEMPLERGEKWLKVHEKDFDKLEGRTTGRETLFQGDALDKVEERKTQRSLYEQMSSQSPPISPRRPRSQGAGGAVPIAEQMKLVEVWWKEMAGKREATVQPLSRVTDFLIEKKIVTERERARKLIVGPLLQARNVKKASDTNINDIFFEDFKRIFTRGIFREAVLNITSSVDQQLAGSLSELPMTLKIINYQRKLMLGGLAHEQRGADILNSLHEYDRVEGSGSDHKSDKHFHSNESWVKSALEKGVNPKVIASLGGAAAEEALAKIRLEEARKGEISEVKELQIVPAGEFVMPPSLRDIDDQEEVTMELDPQIKRHFRASGGARRGLGGGDLEVAVPEKYLSTTRRERAGEENEVLKQFQEVAGRAV